MSMIKWICTDVDGTFLSSDHTVSSLTAQTYREVQRHGIDIIFTTGRTPRATLNVMERNKEFKDRYASFCPGIYCNGALILGNSFDDVVQIKTLPRRAAQILADFAYKHFALHPEQRVVMMVHHAKGAYVDYEGQMWRDFQATYSEEEAEILNRPIQDILRDDIPDDLLQLHCCGSVQYVPALKKAIEADQATMKELHDLGTYLVSGIPECMTLVRTDVNKAEGIRTLAARYPTKYRMGELMTLGDGGNDKEMLQIPEAAATVAMGQADSSLQRVAKRIASSNADEGWARIVQELVFEETFSEEKKE
eukprot:Gregarina_sp_Pseudo_9__1927@NODE_2325_length_1039_cov_74_887000_g2141_i0_p1_GENE_NODE_2325_length_1039_cov_74_887000_g2141_i0NODE_2325_length_1039_cov_74_887000_g2141_i0_p1_ORF_typecomplete_len307_score19_60Hydrolase_3/PF08282_12/1_4e37S6PP/PF05116_13/12S6PP/PF05116_13/0_0052HAD/PF12710_7/21HAD/PF12710_7/6_5Hydrolase_6/PF13344_6/0_47Acid_phosphat_B/PF03767_14/5_4e02Acid_phosphat_B/PF03767_14/1Acid_phosphat_B/PF03767_14/4_1e03_NODE_2325_length_1039_cov_74_887000_g2141_i069989